jgi:uncharacterized membrane protein YqaE (UPF0057 family)
MRKFLSFMMLVIVTSLFFGSCTVEKRLHSRGYYVQWKHSYHGSNEATTDIAKENKTAIQEERTQDESSLIEESIASNDNAVSETTLSPSSIAFENNAPVAIQDTDVKLVNEMNYSGRVNGSKVKNESNKFVKPLVKKALKSDSKSAGGPDKALLMVLCFFIPWLAVGLATNWELKPLIFNLLWSLTCIGGIIHALVVVSREA